MEKLPIGPCAGSCGTAAFRGSPVIVSDISTDPLWDVPEHRALALKYGPQASWSSPCSSSKGKEHTQLSQVHGNKGGNDLTKSHPDPAATTPSTASAAIGPPPVNIPLTTSWTVPSPPTATR